MKNCSEAVNGKLDSGRVCSSALNICQSLVFVSRKRGGKSELSPVLMNKTLNLTLFSPFLSVCVCVCAHTCVSARVLKHHKGPGPSPAPPPSYKCEGIVKSVRQMGPMLPLLSFHTEGRAEQMDSHQQQQESPQAKTGAEDTGTGLLLRQAGNFNPQILPHNSRHESLKHQGVISGISRWTGIPDSRWEKAQFSRLDS